MKSSYAIHAALITLATAAVGCGAPTGDTAITGSVDGAPFTVRSAIYTTVEAKGFELTGTSIVVALSDAPDLCAREHANQGSRGARTVYVGLNDDGKPPHLGGDYAIVIADPVPRPTGGKRAQIFWERNGDDCRGEALKPATRGQLRLDRADSSLVTGNFDLTFDGGDRLAGTFSALSCSDFDPNRTPLDSCR